MTFCKNNVTHDSSKSMTETTFLVPSFCYFLQFCPWLEQYKAASYYNETMNLEKPKLSGDFSGNQEKPKLSGNFFPWIKLCLHDRHFSTLKKRTLGVNPSKAYGL